MKDVLGILLLGIGGYFIYENFFAAPSVPVATAATSAGSPPVPATVANTNLTVADAATLPYNTAITSAQMLAVQGQLDTNLQAGQIPQIAGNSVLAFMLGWGGLPQGTTRQALGENYGFDGVNWNLVPAGTAGLTGLGQVRTMTRAFPSNYVRRSR